MSRLANELHPQKALSSILVNDIGIATYANELHPSKAYALMLVTDEGIVTLLTFVWSTPNNTSHLRPLQILSTSRVLHQYTYLVAFWKGKVQSTRGPSPISRLPHWHPTGRRCKRAVVVSWHPRQHAGNNAAARGWARPAVPLLVSLTSNSRVYFV